MNTADAIRAKVQELTRALGKKPRPPDDDEILPETGLLDSASILELILWVETEFGIEVEQTDFSIEKLGSIRRIVEYIESKQTT